jgi:hypothetical protein
MTHYIKAIAGIGLISLMPGTAAADRGYSSGHAAITLGFPNASITVGRTWDNAPREVVVERVTHKLPEADDADEVVPEAEAEDYSEADVIEEEAVPEERVIIEKRRPRIARKVTIIERYEEPVYVERETVVRKVYVEPRCENRTEVFVHAAPRRVVYVPAPTVIVQSPRHVHREVRVIGGGHTHGGSYRGYSGGTVSHSHGGSVQVHQGPRNLFPEDSGRPMRNRGTRSLVQVGGHSH